MDYQGTIIASLFTLGLFGGFSHCTSMCGPFVLTQVGNRLSKIEIKDATPLRKLSGLALLPYHFGRITTYCLIALFSSFLSLNLKNSIFFKEFAGLVLIVAALIIFNSAIAKINLPFTIPPVFRAVKIPQPVKKNLKNLINFLFSNPTGFKNYFLGIILGFIPCGLVYGAISATLALDNYLMVFLAMLAFGIGTIPSLFLTACGGYWFFDGIKNHLKLLTKIIMSVNVITLLVMAFGLIFNKI
ncbi:MAG: hypothetical protein K0R25_190 [Rickettsiaceae bacterium]|jgi:sulfite exporter TauE/SafE|nr:hypothetical protein [Rickettsiaceae bacterium]